MTDDRLELANFLLKMGETEEARQTLEAFLKENRTRVEAWQLYAETWPDPENKKRVWKVCLRFNPESVEAKRALAFLNGELNNPPQRARKNDLYQPKRKINYLFLIFSGLAGLLIMLVLMGTYALLKAQPESGSPPVSGPQPGFGPQPADPAQYRHSQPVEYYLYAPKYYSPDHAWPLFVGLHGSGSSGLECWNLWQTYADQEGFILLCPSIPGEAGGYYQDVGEGTVWSAVGQVQKDYRVSSRLFLAGFSAGAYFIQGFALHYPQSVSGLAILSTGYYVPGLQTRVPILVAIGGADHPDSIRANQELVADLTQKGFDVQYQVFPGVGHEVTQEAKNLTIVFFRKTIGK